MKLNFDVIGISETKEQSSGFFFQMLTLIAISFILSQCSNTSVGGVGLYANKNLDHMTRYALT